MNYTLIPGQSHEASEEETMSMIRSVLTEDKDTPKPQPERKVAVTPEPAKPVEDTPTEELRAFVERTPEPAPRRRATDLPEITGVDATPKGPGLISRVLQRALRPLARVLGRVRGFQPTTRHIAIASMALLIVLRPHWFAIGAVLMLALVIGTVFALGTDRIWRGVLNWLDRVSVRDNARATELRSKLDAFAYRWDGFLDLFPDGMVDGLYMPDFQSLRQAEIDHQEVVAERLTRMAQES